jgi:bifunctional non-homologous end joining protein LigD
MSLARYKEKRNFKKTGEPSGEKKSSKKDLIFVVQKHNAARLHYDFRLELDGVLKSWAVPRGPSLNPEDKRLAMMVEDHPYDYKDFEGIIPKGNYGAGQVIVWDKGTYHPLLTDDREEGIKHLHKGLYSGDLKFVLNGKKLKGAFGLVKMRGKEDNAWLLIKKKDEYVSDEDITERDASVVSGKTIDDLRAFPENEAAWKSSRNSDNIIEKKKQIKKAGKTKSSLQNKTADFSATLKKSGAKKAKMPSAVKPMLAALVDAPFNDEDWLFEIKLDGYRVIAEIDNGNVNLHSRKNLSFNRNFLPVVKALEEINNKVILDGEVVVLDKEGRSGFQLLQNYQRTGEGNLVYYVFDILYLNDYDLRELPLLKRKEILKEFLPVSDIIRYSDHIENSGKEFFDLAQKSKLEGIVAKKSSSAYQADKRSKDWLKIKTRRQQEAIICGFTRPKGSRKAFGALVLGVYDKDELIYIGHTGGGFDNNALAEIKNRLAPLITKTSPFKKRHRTNTPVTWVEPKLVCEVTFSEWTEEGYMRHPVYMGMREDKDPREVKRKLPAETEELQEPENNSPPAAGNSGGRGNVDKEVSINKVKLKFSNLDKVYFPDEGYTKGDIIDYYDKISQHILPYLKGRPESLNRHPNGIKGESFFQKDMRDTAPAWADTRLIYSESNNKDINYFICNDKASLLYLVNLGCIEINPWFSRVENLEYPDYAVIDLDPEEIGFDKVIETALVVKEVLDEAKAKSFIKTSGATGLHIYIPLKAKYNYEIAKEFAHVIGKIVNNKIPDITSIERSPSKRKGKVYLDYLQNRAGQTLAAPYSVRPRPGATVAAPLEWKEVKKGLHPGKFTIKNIFERLKAKGDLFKPVLGPGVNIEKCMNELERKGY